MQVAEKVTDIWRTPDWLVKALQLRCEADGFVLDAAADETNTRGHFYISRRADALGPTPWAVYACGTRALEPSDESDGRWPLSILCNPPFSKLGAFVRRCIEEVQRDGHTIALITLADISTSYWRLLERPPEGVDVERVRIRGRWSCDPPPGVQVSTPTRPMAAWIIRPEPVPPKRAKGGAR